MKRAAALTSSRRNLGHKPVNNLTFKRLIKVLPPAALSGSVRDTRLTATPALI